MSHPRGDISQVNFLGRHFFSTSFPLHLSYDVPSFISLLSKLVVYICCYELFGFPEKGCNYIYGASVLRERLKRRAQLVLCLYKHGYLLVNRQKCVNVRHRGLKQLKFVTVLDIITLLYKINCTIYNRAPQSTSSIIHEFIVRIFYI